MDLLSSLTLAVAMITLAAIPGPGIFVVLSQTTKYGLARGSCCIAGIFFGDYIYIALALAGLTALSSTMGQLFVVIQYAGAAYLIFLGLSLLRHSKEPETNKKQGKSVLNGPLQAFAAGLLTTLSNPKAILFYASLFPSLVQLDRLNTIDIAIIYAITTLCVGGVMLSYASASLYLNSRSLARSSNWQAYLASALMVGAGIYLLVRS